MAKEKTHNEMTQEEREKEAREYVESQEPIRREEPVTLNEPGDNVPAAPEPARKK